MREKLKKEMFKIVEKLGECRECELKEKCGTYVLMREDLRRLYKHFIEIEYGNINNGQTTTYN